jgi:hypothetical protein
MPDEFEDHQTGLTSPAWAAVAIVPSDSVPLAQTTRAIYVGQTGNLRLRMASTDVVTLASVPAGAMLPLRVAQVLATGTTAGALIGLR